MSQNKVPQGWQPVEVSEMTKIVLPFRPTIDKIVAAWLLVYLIAQRALDHYVIEPVGRQHPAPAQWEHWANEGAYVIDVGAGEGGQKYQNVGKRQLRQAQRQKAENPDQKGDKLFIGSATAIVAGREAKELYETDPVVKQLVDMTVRNNKTGYLKQYDYSIVGILREMYKAGFNRQEVIAKAFKAITYWYKAQTRTEKQRKVWSDRTRESLLECEELRETLKRCNSDFRDFTVGRLMLDMWICGATHETIKLEADYFLDGLATAEAKEAAELESIWRSAEKRWFGHDREEDGTEVPNTHKGVLVYTEDDRLARYIFRTETSGDGSRLKAVIVRGDTHEGQTRDDERQQQPHVALLFSNGVSQRGIKELAAILIHSEGHTQFDNWGRWCIYPCDEVGRPKGNIQALLNGAPGHWGRETLLSDDHLIDLVEGLVIEGEHYTPQYAEQVADGIIGLQDPKYRRRIDRLALVKTLTGEKAEKFPYHIESMLMGEWENRTGNRRNGPQGERGDQPRRNDKPAPATQAITAEDANQSVEVLLDKVSVRAMRGLADNQISTIGELATLTRKQLWKMGFGDPSLDQIEQALESMGLALGMTEAPEPATNGE